MSNFTLVIPTHNRHNYLKRSIEYYKDLDADIIYCDSSIEKYIGDISSNIQYLHLPNKKFDEKILISFERIKSEFVALCADDDFILIESLYNGEAFLEENRNYSTVLGKYIAFNENFDGNYFQLYQELPNDINFNPFKNVEDFFKNYYMIMWAMYRKDVLRKAFKIINQARFINDNFIELVIGACACYVGGIKFQNNIWGVRELNRLDHWGARSPEIIKNQTIEFKTDYLAFKEFLDCETTSGYAELALNSYSRFQNANNSTLKIIMKSVVPKVIIMQIKKIINKTDSTILKPLDFESFEIQQLSKITTILNSSNLLNNKH